MRCREPKKYQVQREVNWFGVLAYAFFFSSFGFYLWIRITKTLDIGLFLVRIDITSPQKRAVNEH